MNGTGDFEMGSSLTLLPFCAENCSSHLTLEGVLSINCGLKNESI